MTHEKCWKRKTTNQEFWVHQNSPFKNVREIKTISDKQKFKMSISSKAALTRNAKGSLSWNRKAQHSNSNPYENKKISNKDKYMDKYKVCVSIILIHNSTLFFYEL